MIKTGVVNGKGGVTKSTTTLNLAATAAKNGKKTLLIDLDPQGSSSNNCGMEELSIENDIDLDAYSAYRIFNERVAPSELALQTKYENLHIIPAGLDLMKLEQEIPTIPNGDTILDRVLRSDNDLDYDLIIFDSPGFIGHIVHSIANACDSVIIPNLATASSTRGLIDVFQMLDQMNDFRAAFERDDITIRGHFFCRSEPTTRIHKEQTLEVIELFNEMGFPKNTHKENISIKRTTKIPQSESSLQPFVYMFPENDVTHQFNRLFKELFPELV